MATNTSIDSSFYMHEFQASTARNRPNSRSPDGNDIKRCPPTFMLRVIEENGLLESSKVKLMAKEYLSFYIVDFLENYSKTKGVNQPPAVYLLEYMAQRRMDFISIKKNVNSIALSLGFFAPSSYEISFFYDLFNQECSLTKVAGNYCYCRRIVKEFLYQNKTLEEVRLPLHAWTTLIKRIFKNQPISDISSRLREKITTHNKIKVIETHNDKRRYDGNAQNVPLSLLSQKWDVDALYFIILCVEELNNPANYKRSMKPRGMQDDLDEYDIVSKNVRVAERPNPYYDLHRDNNRSASRGRSPYSNNVTYYEPSRDLHRPGGRSEYSPSRPVNTGAIDHYRDNFNYEDYDNEYQHHDRLKLKDKIALGTFEKRTTLEELLWTLKLFERMANNHSEVNGFLQQMQKDFLTVKNKLKRTDPKIFDDVNPKFVSKYVTRKIDEPEDRYIDNILGIRDKFDPKAADMMRLKISEEELDEEERSRTKPKINPENFTQEVLLSQLMASQKWEDEDFGAILTRPSQPQQLPGHAYGDIVRKLVDSESSLDESAGRKSRKSVSRDPARKYKDRDGEHRGRGNKDDPYGSLDDEEGSRRHSRTGDHSEGRRTPSGLLVADSDQKRRPSYLPGDSEGHSAKRRPSHLGAGDYSDGKSLSGPSVSDHSDNKRRGSKVPASDGHHAGGKRNSDPYNLDPNRDRDPNNQFGIHGVDVTPGGEPETPLPVTDFVKGLQDGKNPSVSQFDPSNHNSRNDGHYATGGDASSYPSSRAPANDFATNNNGSHPANKSNAPSSFSSINNSSLPPNNHRGAPGSSHGGDSSHPARNADIHSDFSSHDPANKNRGAPGGHHGVDSDSVSAPGYNAAKKAPGGGNPSSSGDGSASDNYSSAIGGGPGKGRPGATNKAHADDTSDFTSNPRGGNGPHSDFHDDSSVPGKGGHGAKSDLSSPDGKHGAKSDLSSSPDGKHHAGDKSDLSSPEGKHGGKGGDHSSPEGHKGDNFSSPDRHSEADGGEKGGSPLKSLKKTFGQTSNDSLTSDNTQTVSADIQAQEKSMFADKLKRVASDKKPEMNTDIKKSFGQQSTDSLHSGRSQSGDTASVVAAGINKTHQDANAARKSILKQDNPTTTTMLEAQEDKGSRFNAPAFMKKPGNTLGAPSKAPEENKRVSISPQPEEKRKSVMKPDEKPAEPKQSILKTPSYSGEAKQPEPKPEPKPETRASIKPPAGENAKPRFSIPNFTKRPSDDKSLDKSLDKSGDLTSSVLNPPVKKAEEPAARKSIREPAADNAGEVSKPKFTVPKFGKKSPNTSSTDSLPTPQQTPQNKAAPTLTVEKPKVEEPALPRKTEEKPRAEEPAPRKSILRNTSPSPDPKNESPAPRKSVIMAANPVTEPKKEEKKEQSPAPLPRKSILRDTSPPPAQKKEEPKKEDPPKKTPIPTPATTASTGRKPNLLDEIKNPPKLRAASPPNKELSPPRDSASNESSPVPALPRKSILKDNLPVQQPQNTAAAALPRKSVLRDTSPVVPAEIKKEPSPVPSKTEVQQKVPSPVPSKNEIQQKVPSPVPSKNDVPVTPKKEEVPAVIKKEEAPVVRKSVLKDNSVSPMKNDIPAEIKKEPSPVPSKNEVQQKVPSPIPSKSDVPSIQVTPKKEGAPGIILTQPTLKKEEPAPALPRKSVLKDAAPIPAEIKKEPSPLPSKTEVQQKVPSPVPSKNDVPVTPKKEEAPAVIKKEEPPVVGKSVLKDSAPVQQPQNAAADLPRKSVLKDSSPSPIPSKTEVQQKVPSPVPSKNEVQQKVPSPIPSKNEVPATPKKEEVPAISKPALNTQNPVQQPAVNPPAKEEPVLPRKNSVMKKTFGQADEDSKKGGEAINKSAPEANNAARKSISKAGAPSTQPTNNAANNPPTNAAGSESKDFTLHGVKVSTIKTLDTKPTDFNNQMSNSVTSSPNISPLSSPNVSPQKSQPVPEKRASVIKPTSVANNVMNQAVDKVNNTSASTTNQVNQAASKVAGNVPSNVAGAVGGNNSASESESERRKSTVPKFNAPKFLKK